MAKVIISFTEEQWAEIVNDVLRRLWLDGYITYEELEQLQT